MTEIHSRYKLVRSPLYCNFSISFRFAETLNLNNIYSKGPWETDNCFCLIEIHLKCSKIFDACILASQFPECSGHCYSGRVARAALLTPVPPPVLPRLASHSGVHIHHSSVQHPASTTVEPWPSHRVENWSVIWISSILSKFIYHKNVDRFITFIVICTNYFYFESSECWG